MEKDRERLTQDFAHITHAPGDVILLDRIPHWNANIPLEPLTQSKAMVVIALGSDIDNSFHTMRFELLNMLFRCQFRSEKEKVWEDR